MRWITTALCLGTLFIQTIHAAQQDVDFYGESIRLSYDEALFARYNEDISREQGIVDFYKDLESRPYTTYLNALQKAKSTYQLNDWLYYRLLEQSLDDLCRSRSDRFQSVVSWFILVQSGYDARITFTKSRIFVNVATKEDLFESPMFEMRGELFANLSVILYEGRYVNTVYEVQFIPNDKGKDFSFILDQHPKLEPRLSKRKFYFDFEGKDYELSAQVDETIIEVMREYPSFDEIYFVTAPFSATTRKTLIPALEDAMKGMSEKQRIKFLLSFTRRGLLYGSDRRGFGKKNKPLTAEESLYYEKVDCEDKVAVFYNLLKELTDLEGIVLALPNHLSFGVYFKEAEGETFRFKGRKYTICDPTGPENDDSIGVFPFRTELRKGEVLGEL